MEGAKISQRAYDSLQTSIINVQRLDKAPHFTTITN